MFVGLTRSGSNLQSSGIHYGGVLAQPPPSNDAAIQVLSPTVLLVTTHVAW